MSDNAESAQPRPWLCIAYAYPPIQRSGTHRTAAFVRGLVQHGWQATVLTVSPPAGEAIDEDLMNGVPAATCIVRSAWLRPVDSLARRVRGWFRAPANARIPKNPNGSCASKPSSDPSLRSSISKWLSTPDSRVGWIAPAIAAGVSAIRRRKPEIIYSTSPYASAHLIALALHWLTRVPWVADFRDPWCGNPFEDKRSSLVERINGWLEACVLRSASRVICNTPTMEQTFVKRRPALRVKIGTIMNGVDMEAMRSVHPQRLGGENDFVFAHCGQFYGPRTPETLFSALRMLVSEYPAEAARVRLALIGSASFQGRSLLEIATQSGVAGCVLIYGERSHREALCLAAGADALVLMGAAGAGDDIQVPQKLFEYLALRRPILALIGRENPGVQILRESGADAAVCEPGDAAGVAQAMRQLGEPARRPAPASWHGVHRFDRSLRVRELLSVFEELANSRVQGQDSLPVRHRRQARSLDEFRDPSMMPA